MNTTSRITRVAILLCAIGLAGCASRSSAPTPNAGPATEAVPAGDLASLRAAARARPNDAATLAALADALQTANELPEALTQIDRALALAPPTAERLRLQGRLALRLGNPAKAEGAYRAADRAEPGRIDTLTGLGVALGLLGRFPEAQGPLRAALDQQPGDWVLRGNLAFALINSDEAQAAVAVLQDAELNATAPRNARHNLAMAMVGAGQRDRAVRMLRIDMGRTEAMELANGFARYVSAVRAR